MYDDDWKDNLQNIVELMPKYFDVPKENIWTFKITDEQRRSIDNGEVQLAEQHGNQCQTFARQCVHIGRENFMKTAERCDR